MSSEYLGRGSCEPFPPQPGAPPSLYVGGTGRLIIKWKNHPRLNRTDCIDSDGHVRGRPLSRCSSNDWPMGCRRLTLSCHHPRGLVLILESLQRMKSVEAWCLNSSAALSVLAIWLSLSKIKGKLSYLTSES